VAKKKALSAADWDGILSDVALLAMRTYKDPKRDKDGLDGLAAALVFLNTLGSELPDWVKNSLAATQYAAVFGGGTHRQNKLRRKMETFVQDLTRYACVLTCDKDKNPTRHVKMGTFIKILSGQRLNRRESAQFTKPPAKRNHGRRSNIFEDAFERMQGEWAAPADSSGVRQSYYRVQRMFRSKRLASYVAVRVTEALMSRSPVL
jgi:hypothetical protein